MKYFIIILSIFNVFVSIAATAYQDLIAEEGKANTIPSIINPISTIKDKLNSITHNTKSKAEFPPKISMPLTNLSLFLETMPTIKAQNETIWYNKSAHNYCAASSAFPIKPDIYDPITGFGKIEILPGYYGYLQYFNTFWQGGNDKKNIPAKELLNLLKIEDKPIKLGLLPFGTGLYFVECSNENGALNMTIKIRL